MEKDEELIDRFFLLIINNFDNWGVLALAFIWIPETTMVHFFLQIILFLFLRRWFERIVYHFKTEAKSNTRETPAFEIYDNMQCFSEFEYLLCSKAPWLIFTNTMALETSKIRRKFLTNKKPLISINIPLLDISPHVTLIWGCLIPSDESFISVSQQTLDQLGRCQ